MSRIPIDDEQNDQVDPMDAEPVEPAGLEGEMQRLQTERDELYERLARTTADFQNSRKRIQAEADQRLVYANSTLIKSLLPVIDNFERALAVDPGTTDAGTILKGMQIVHDQWMTVLKQQNVEEIAPQPGERFDPERHEALMQKPGDYSEPTIVQLLEKGYTLHDRTLRPAKVAVGVKQGNAE